MKPNLTIGGLSGRRRPGNHRQGSHVKGLTKVTGSSVVPGQISSGVAVFRSSRWLGLGDTGAMGGGGVRRDRPDCRP
jgi:hypothetical protein